MRQLYYVKPGHLEWRDVPEPKLASDGDALVRPIAVTRCDLDLLIATGQAGFPGPFAMGHEAVGEVVQVGDSVRSFKPGERVLVPFQINCGRCGRCQAGQTGLCEAVPYRSSFGMAPLAGVEYGGALSDLMRVPFADHMLVATPDGMSPEALAGVADNVTDAYRFVAPHLRARPGLRILVVGGLGQGMGLYIVQWAVALGAGSVVYVDDDPQRLALAKRAGAEVVELTVDSNTLPARRFPLTIDASGREEGLAFAIRSTEFEGLCHRTYGDLKPQTLVPLRDMYGIGMNLRLSRVHVRHLIPEVLQHVASGRTHPEDIITCRASFAEAAERMLDPTIKIVFLP
jgi:threonine dehydrogenase-like Zn-dependent dehydrogenase